MSRCKRTLAILCAVLLAPAGPLAAQKSKSRRPAAAAHRGIRRTFVTAAYTTWKEFVALETTAASDHTTADYFGYAFGAGVENYWRPRHGYALTAQYLIGKAGIGSGDMGNIVYTNQGGIKWWGAYGALQYSYRWTGAITSAIGPYGLYRNVTFPQGGGATPASAANLNGGLMVTFRMRLFNGFEAQQAVGFLLVNASTIWSLGIGYHF